MLESEGVQATRMVRESSTSSGNFTDGGWSPGQPHGGDGFSLLEGCWAGGSILRVPSGILANLLLEKLLGLPWWLNGKQFACQCRDMGSIPDPGRSLMSWSNRATTIELVL